MNSKVKREQKLLYKIYDTLVKSDIDKYNSRSRGVVEYLPCSIKSFFDVRWGPINTIVSGSADDIRQNTILAFVETAIANNIPVLVIHENKYSVVSEINKTFKNYNCFDISVASPCYEPFFNLSSNEITSLIIEAAPKSFDLKHNVRYYIDGINTLLIKSGKKTSFKMLLTCPHMLIFDKVDEYINKGIITDSDGQDIKSKLVMGQSENYKLESYLQELKMQMSNIIYDSKNKLSPMNIQKFIEKNGVMTFNIGSITNNLLLNLVILQLKHSLSKGKKIALVLDSLSLTGNEMLNELVKSNTEQISLLISGDDVFSMIDGNDQSFAALIGKCQRLVVLTHSSAKSAKAWADVFGEYDKKEKTYSMSSGGNYRTPFSLLSNKNYNSSVNINQRREYIVKPERIMRLGFNEAYIYSNYENELAHAEIIV